MTARVDAALEAAAAGFRVIVIPPGRKGPAMSDWPGRATTNEATIRRWFAEAPGSNYGLVMGGGLLAIDVDVKDADGRGALRELAERLGSALPATRMHRTPSGGLHLIYRVPDGRDFANAVGMVPGVDLRSAGGQVVGPGSTTMAGAYVLEADRPPAELPAPWVDELTRLAPPPSARAYAAVDADLGDRDLLVDGRKAWLRDRVWQLRRTGLGEAAIVAALDAEAPERIAEAERYAGEIRRLARNVVRRDPGAEERVSGLVGAELRRYRSLGLDDAEAAAAVEAEIRDAFPVRSARMLMNAPEPEPLVGAWLPKGAFAALFGPEWSGKSLVAIDWALCLASGVPWCGIPLERTDVLYVLGEGVPGFGKRLRAWVHHRRRDDALDSLAVHTGGFSFAEADAVAGLVEYAERYQPGLVIVDTLARTIGGDENGSVEMGRVIGAQSGIARVSPATTVLLLCHPGKDAEKGIRGHSSLAAALDVSIRAAGTPSAHDAADTPTDGYTGGSVTLFSVKNKDGARVPSVELAMHAAGRSVYLDAGRPPQFPEAMPRSRQGGRGRQDTGGVD